MLSNNNSMKIMSAYVIWYLYGVVLMGLLVSHVSSAKYHDIHYESKDDTRNSELRRRQIEFPLDQFFQRTTAELTTAFDNDAALDDDLGLSIGSSSAGAPSTASQIQSQPQPQLPQSISNLIVAAAVPQPPAPQQLVRTVMNSGLRR